MAINWVPIWGKLQEHGDCLIFKGGSSPQEDGRVVYNTGTFISNQTFGGGKLSASFVGRNPLWDNA